MVFQKPNPFPKSIFDNVAFGPRLLGLEGPGRAVERALAQAALWDEVGNRLRTTPSASRVGSSSGSASRARSPSSPT